MDHGRYRGPRCDRLVAGILARSGRHSPHPCRARGVARPAEVLVSMALSRPSLLRMRPLVQNPARPTNQPFTSGNAGHCILGRQPHRMHSVGDEVYELRLVAILYIPSEQRFRPLALGSAEWCAGPHSGGRAHPLTRPRSFRGGRVVGAAPRWCAAAGASGMQVINGVEVIACRAGTVRSLHRCALKRRPGAARRSVSRAQGHQELPRGPVVVVVGLGSGLLGASGWWLLLVSSEGV